MIINGRQIADRILKDLKVKVADRDLYMAAVLVGNDPGLAKFAELKKKAAELAGIKFRLIVLAENYGQEKVENIIKDLNSDSSVHGIFVELPLPRNLDKVKILNLISKKKDVDLLGNEAKKSFEDGDFSVLPPTVFAIDQIMGEFNIDPTGKRVAIFGKGELVGRPASVWFRKMGCEVSEIDEFTKTPELLSQKADIIISGVGRPGLISPDMIKKQAIIFDFGYGVKDGRMKGDVCDDVAAKVSLITPVPNGVGPLVVAAIFHNLLLRNES